MPSKPDDYEVQLIAKIQNYKFSFFEPIKIYPGIDKWLSASAMQKAIRRNQPEIAVSAALSLFYNDSAKFWNRLKIISMEDISPTAFDLVSDLMFVANQHTWRKKHLASETVIKYFVVCFCEARKSRVANDLLCISNYHPDYKDVTLELSKASFSALANIYADVSQDIYLRSISAWYICGVQARRYRNMQERRGSWRDFLSLHPASEYPEGFLSVMHKGFAYGEGHSRTYALSWLKVNQAKRISFSNETKESVVVGKWTSEAFDIHTRIGQASYRGVLKRNNEISSFLEKYLPDVNHLRALGMTIFAIEGMSLNARENFAGLDTLLSHATDSYVAGYSLSGEMKHHFFDVVMQNMDLIHNERIKAAKEIAWIEARPVQHNFLI